MRDTELLELEYRDAELEYLVVSRMWMGGGTLCGVPPLCQVVRAPAQLLEYLVVSRFLKSPELEYLVVSRMRPGRTEELTRP